MTEKPPLFQYFKGSVKILLEKYNLTKEQKSTVNKGLNTEIFCQNFLEKVLPARLVIHRGGEITDTDRNQTDQIDIIVYRDDCPILDFEGANTYFMEGTFAAIEVKSRLNREDLQHCLRKFRRVNDLKTTRRVVIPADLQFDHILRCIVAYESATWKTLLDELNTPDNKNLVDLVCVLDKGIIINPRKFIKIPMYRGTFELYTINGKASSLAWFYYYLFTYTSEFIRTNLNLLPYFKPLDYWDEEKDNIS